MQVNVRGVVNGLSRKRLLITVIAICAWAAVAATASATVTPQLAPNYLHTCALISSGEVKCFGDNAFGQLGNGDKPTDSYSPVGVDGISNARSIATVDSSSCALLASGTVKCWGGDHVGQLGNGPGTDGSSTPISVPGLSGVTQISGADNTFCVLIGDGTVKCWGENSALQAGVIGDGQVDLPTTVAGLFGVTEVAVGGVASCAILSDTSVRCWGDDSLGSLGNGTDLNDGLTTAVPQTVTGLSGVTDLAASYAHVCALLSDGKVKCWGINETFGALGIGITTPGSIRKSPVSVTGLSGVTALAAGLSGDCALINDGSVKCWGYGDNGEIGDGLRSDSPVPTVVPGLTGVAYIPRTFDQTMCAANADGETKCWGYNVNGQAGIAPSGSPYRSTPVTVSGLDLVLELVSSTPIVKVPASDPTVTVPEVPGGSPVVAESMSLKLGSKIKIVRKNFQIKGLLTVVPGSGMSAASACSGSVIVTARYKLRTSRSSGNTASKTAQKSVALTMSNGGCLASFTLLMPAQHTAGTRKAISVSFGGNSMMQAFTVERTVKLPKSR